MSQLNSTGIPFGGMTLVSSKTPRNRQQKSNQTAFAQGHAFRSVHSQQSNKENITHECFPGSNPLTPILTENYINPSCQQTWQFSQPEDLYSASSCLAASYGKAAIGLSASYEETEESSREHDLSECQRLPQDYYQFLSGILADENLSENDIDDDESFTFSERDPDSELEDDCSPKRVTLKEYRDLRQQQSHQGSNIESGPRILPHFIPLDRHRIAIRRQLTELFQTLLQVNIVASHQGAKYKDVFFVTSLMIRRLLEERTRVRLELPLPPDTSSLPGRQTTVITRSAWHSALPGEISDRPAIIDIPALAIWAKRSAPIRSLQECFVILGRDNINPALVPPYPDSQVPVISKAAKFTLAEDKLLRLGLQKFGYARAASATRNVMSPLSPDWERICSRYIPGRTVHQARVRYKTLFRKGDFVKGVFNSNPDAKHESLHLTDEEFELVEQGVKLYGNQWSRIVKQFLPHRDRKMVRREYLRIKANQKPNDPNNIANADQHQSPSGTSPSFDDDDGLGGDAGSLIRTAFENIDSEARSPLPELNAMPLTGLSLPQEPSWARKFDSPASEGTPQSQAIEVTFNKAFDREILIAAKRYGSNVRLWPEDCISLFQKPGYTRSVIKARLKHLILILAQRKNLNTCL